MHLGDIGLGDELASEGYFADQEWARSVRDVVEKHRLLVVRGPSGSGKSAFARALARAVNAHSLRPFVEKQVDHNWDASSMIGYPDIKSGSMDTVLGALAEGVFAHAETGGTWLILDDVNGIDPSLLFSPLFAALDAKRGDAYFEHERLFRDDTGFRTRVPLPGNFRVVATMIGGKSLPMRGHWGLDRRAGIIVLNRLSLENEMRAVLECVRAGSPWPDADLQARFVGSYVKAFRVIRDSIHEVLRGRLTVGVACRYAQVEIGDVLSLAGTDLDADEMASRRLVNLVSDQLDGIDGILLRDAADAIEAIGMSRVAGQLRSMGQD